MRLFNNQTSDGVTREVRIVAGSKGANLYVVGDLGGGKITTEVLVPDGVTWIPSDPDEYVTKQGLYTIASSSVILRVRLSGSTNPNVTIWLMLDDIANQQFVSRGHANLEGV